MNEIEKTIRMLSDMKLSFSQNYIQEAFDVSIEALREKTERSRGCVWCNENNKVFHDGQHFHLFCSYCGKRLEVENGINIKSRKHRKEVRE